ncbi:MAG: hypothetical protein RR215_03220 [Ruthenibacterium sp.]
MRKIKHLWRRLCAALHFEDRAQRTAFANILRFFAVMLVLTLVARAASNAALPTVNTARPVRGTITKSLSVQGLIRAAGAAPLAVPQGIPVQSVLIIEGEHAEAGQTLATFDAQAVASAIALQQAELKKQQVQAAQLRKTAQPDATAVAVAQQSLDWAYADGKKAQDALTYWQSQPDSPERTNALAAAAAQIDAAQRAAQQAELARSSAIQSYNSAEAAAQDKQNSDAADAGILALAIAEKKEQIAALQALQKADCVLTAPASGIVQSIQLTAGQNTEKIACSIADAAQGQLFSFVLDEENAKLAQVGSPMTIHQKEISAELSLSAVTLEPDGTARAAVRLAAGAWKEGTAEGKVTLSEKSYDICVPAGAVHQDNAGYFVYLLQEQNTVLGAQQVLARTPVTVQESGETLTAVQGALTPQSVIAVSSDKPLSAHAKVRVAS